MNVIKISELDESSLRILYSENHLRAKEIGSLAGLTESSILLKLKKYGIPKLELSDKRKDVKVIYTGKVKQSQKLGAERLRDLCEKGLTDEEIGKLYGMSGVGVAYKREKLGIKASDKNRPELLTRKAFLDTPKDILEKDYHTLTVKGFSRKYGISKTLWLPHLRSLGIKGKEEHRVASYPDLTDKQRQLLIGSLLGDGCIAEGRYTEYHSVKQKGYLQNKSNIMSPFSLGVRPDGPGYKLLTAALPCFREIAAHFYDTSLKGKLIPLEYIKNNWHESILAYWYLDDGTYDDVNNEAFIFNLCPVESQLGDFLEFLSEELGIPFKYRFSGSIYSVNFPKKYYEKFYSIVKKYATPDVFYKIPEAFLSDVDKDKVIVPDDINHLTPKLYRLMTEEQKREAESALFDLYREKGFPYSCFTETRKEYLFNTFKDNALHNSAVHKGVIKVSTAGMGLLDNLFPNIYDSCRGKGPSGREQWENDDFLKKLIKNRLTHADRINDASFRKGVKLISPSVSNFKPTAAAAIYKEYDINGKILDYSAGFGSRMLAALALGKEYSAFEPNTKTFNNLEKMGKWIKGIDSSAKYTLSCLGSEIRPFKENYFGLAFSSPPYFDLEKYSDEPTQSIIKFPKEQDWLEGYWKPTMENAMISLIAGGIFAVCLSPSSCGSIIAYTEKFFRDRGSEQLPTLELPYAGVFQTDQRYEKVFAWKK